MTVNSAWQETYSEAMLELNREELPRRIEAARTAICQRIEQLKQDIAGSSEELRAINDALRGLRVLANTECQPGDSQDAAKRQNGTAL